VGKKMGSEIKGGKRPTSKGETHTELGIPAFDLKVLDKLVGKWRVSGEAIGHIRYEWMEGGHFMLQHVDLDYEGHRVKGIEVIGHWQKMGEEPTREIRSRFYNAGEGLTLDYVYEVEDDTLTISFGEKGSKNRYRGKFSRDGKTIVGGWKWPGGGYRARLTRELQPNPSGASTKV
jgi:hypothetical protein